MYIILDFTEARGDGVAEASAGPYVTHLHLAPDRQPNHASTSSLSFYGPDALSAANQQCQSTEGKNKSLTSKKRSNVIILSL